MTNEMMQIDFNDIDLYIINGNFLKNQYHLKQIHQKAFQCWHETWCDFHINEYHLVDKLASDDFTRQSEVLCIFYKGECAAITFFNDIDMDDKSACMDSYFSVWGENEFHALGKKGPNVTICSQFTVHKNFRGKNQNILWKDILFPMIMRLFMEKNNSAMTGTMRVKKGMGNMAVENGGTMIVSNKAYQEEGNETVDIVVFYQDEVKKKFKMNKFYKEFENIWSRRITASENKLKVLNAA